MQCFQLRNLTVSEEILEDYHSCFFNTRFSDNMWKGVWQNEKEIQVGGWIKENDVKV